MREKYVYAYTLSRSLSTLLFWTIITHNISIPSPHCFPSENINLKSPLLNEYGRIAGIQYKFCSDIPVMGKKFNSLSLMNNAVQIVWAFFNRMLLFQKIRIVSLNVQQQQRSVTVGRKEASGGRSVFRQRQGLSFDTSNGVSYLTTDNTMQGRSVRKQSQTWIKGTKLVSINIIINPVHRVRM